MEKYQTISASGFIVRPDGKFLIVRRALDDSFGGCWELPGGGIDFGEHPEESVAREVKEEAGLVVAVSHLITAYHYQTSALHHAVEVVYLCLFNGDETDVVISHEHMDYQWITMNDFGPLVMTPLMKQNISTIGNHPLVLSLLA